MLKRNDGYFLAEAIIVISIIATIITIVYANCMDYFVRQNNELSRFNTIDGLYCAKEVKKYFKNEEENFKNTADGYVNIDINGNDFFKDLDIKSIYFSDYDMINLLSTSEVIPSIKKDLKNMDTKDNKCRYRYIVIFNNNNYSTVGVDCNDS